MAIAVTTLVQPIAQREQEFVTLPSYLPQFDGMRAIAILAVMLLHAAPYTEKLHHLDRVFRFGWAGVDLFFVLSGFLITGILLDSKGKPHYFRNFYARRALRIWPIYYVLLFVTFVIVPFMFTTPDLIGAMQKWPIYASYLQNVLFRDLGYNPLAHTWSLAVEEQFYMLWPLVIFILPRKILRSALVVMLFAPLALRLTGNALSWGWHFAAAFPFCRFDSIAMGAAVALWVRSPSCSWFRLKAGGIMAVLAGLAGSIISLAVEKEMAFTYSFLALMFVGCLMLSLPYDFALLRLGALRYIGKISYGLYLYHLPVFSFTYSVLRKWHGDQWWSIAFEFAASFFVAVLSWHFLESPVLRLKARFCE